MSDGCSLCSWSVFVANSVQDWRAGNLVGFVLSSPLLRLVKAHNLLTFTIYAQFTVEELCSTVATFTIYATHTLDYLSFVS